MVPPFTLKCPSLGRCATHSDTLYLCHPGGPRRHSLRQSFKKCLGEESTRIPIQPCGTFPLQPRDATGEYWDSTSFPDLNENNGSQVRVVEARAST